MLVGQVQARRISSPALSMCVPVATKEPMAYTRHVLEANLPYLIKWVRCMLSLLHSSYVQDTVQKKL